MHDAILPKPPPKSTKCQLYPSLGDQGSRGPPRNATGVLEAAATRATERREERDGGWGTEPGRQQGKPQKSQMPEEDGENSL